MKQINLFLLFLLLSGFCSAQEGGRLSGNVRDSTGRPLKGANVALTGTRYAAATDSTGRFRLAAPDGRYRLRATYVGYTTLELTVTLPSGQLDLVLKPKTGMLSEVIVSTDRREHQPRRDRLRYLVNGATQQWPGIDHRDRRISGGCVSYPNRQSAPALAGDR